MPAFMQTSIDTGDQPLIPQRTEAIPLFSKWIGSWQFSINRKPIDSRTLESAYDTEALTWAKKLKRLAVPGSYSRVLEEVTQTVSTSQTVKPLRVLDAGVGAGDLSLALVDILPSDFTLDAFDISNGMLREATRRFQARGINANLKQANATCLPYADNLFDIVMTAHMLEHLVDPSIALAELVRVLKPGGLIVAFVTRQSFLGFALQLKWRIHALTPTKAAHWLRKQSLTRVQCLMPQQKRLSDYFSIACIGYKPKQENETIKLSLRMGGAI